MTHEKRIALIIYVGFAIGIAATLANIDVRLGAAAVAIVIVASIIAWVKAKNGGE